MKLKYCSILFFLFILQGFTAEGLYGQDTIYKADGTKMVAKVLLISDTITCKRFNNLQGPTYLFPKSTLIKIVYSDGAEDIFAKSPSVPQPASVLPAVAAQATVPPPATPSQQKVPSSYGSSPRLMTKRGPFYSVGNSHYSERSMLEMVGKRRDDPALLNEIERTKTCREIQHFTGALGGLLIIGTAAYLIDAANFGGKMTPNILLLPIGIFASEITSLVFKQQRKHHAINVMDLYNPHEQP